MASVVQVPSAGGAGLNGGFSASLGLPGRLARVARAWWSRHQARRQLLEMDDHLLYDIGLTRGDAVREWQKGFWEA